MRVELRFAETGHSDSFFNQSTIRSLVSELQSKYMIEFTNYRLMNKKGRIMRLDDILDDDNMKEKTCVLDANNASESSISQCYYLFS